jgi:hypothetical protein
MKVDYKDREEHTTHAHGALRLVGINIDYETTELILTTLEKLKELKGDFTIMDGSKIQAEHEEKWEKYYKEKQEEK